MSRFRMLTTSERQGDRSEAHCELLTSVKLGPGGARLLAGLPSNRRAGGGGGGVSQAFRARDEIMYLSDLSRHEKGGRIDR